MNREDDLRQLTLLSEAADDMRLRQVDLTVADLAQFQEMQETLSEITRRYVVDLEPVRTELGGRLLTVSDYREFMPGLQIELKPEAPLPPSILEVLNRECPVYGPGNLVKNTHILAWIPDNLSLRNLSEALGGQAGKVLWSNWFIEYAQL